MCITSLLLTFLQNYLYSNLLKFYVIFLKNEKKKNHSRKLENNKCEEHGWGFPKVK